MSRGATAAAEPFYCATPSCDNTIPDDGDETLCDPCTAEMELNRRDALRSMPPRYVRRDDLDAYEVGSAKRERLEREIQG